MYCSKYMHYMYSTCNIIYKQDVLQVKHYTVILYPNLKYCLNMSQSHMFSCGNSLLRLSDTDMCFWTELLQR